MVVRSMHSYTTALQCLAGVWVSLSAEARNKCPTSRLALTPGRPAVGGGGRAGRDTCRRKPVGADPDERSPVARLWCTSGLWRTVCAA